MKKNLLSFLFTLVSFASFAQWQITSGPSGAGHISSLAAKDTTVFAGTESGGVFVSTDHGTTWTASNSGLTNTNDVYALAVDNSYVFAGLHNSLGGNAVFSSTNNAVTWNSTPLSFIFFWSFTISPNWLIAGTWSGVAVSTDHGASWNSFSSGLPSNASVEALAYSGTKIFAGVSSSSSGGTGAFYSTNSGTSWNAFNTGLTNSIVTELAVVGSNVYAGTPSGIFSSPVTSAGWSSVNTGLTNTNIKSLLAVGTGLFAGTSAGVFYSANGTSWTDISSGLPGSDIVYSLTTDSTYLYAGVDTSVYRRSLNEILTGIEKNNSTSIFLSLAPNPASNEFLLTIGNDASSVKENYEVGMFNLFGEEIMKHSLAGENKMMMDVSYLSRGIYFVKVTAASGKSLTQKLVKL